MLAEDIENTDAKNAYIGQLYKFKQWLLQDGNAYIDGESASVLDAIFCAREDKLTGDERRLDFSDALDYELDDTKMILGNFSKIDIIGSE